MKIFRRMKKGIENPMKNPIFNRDIDQKFSLFDYFHKFIYFWYKDENIAYRFRNFPVRWTASSNVDYIQFFYTRPKMIFSKILRNVHPIPNRPPQSKQFLSFC